MKKLTRFNEGLLGAVLMLLVLALLAPYYPAIAQSLTAPGRAYGTILEKGTYVEITGGETIAANAAVYLSTSTGKVMKLTAANATNVVGVTHAACALNTTCIVQISGKATVTADGVVAIGDKVGGTGVSTAGRVAALASTLALNSGALTGTVTSGAVTGALTSTAATVTSGAMTGTVTSGATTGALTSTAAAVTSGAITGTVTSGATTGTVTSGVVNSGTGAVPMVNGTTDALLNSTATTGTLTSTAVTGALTSTAATVTSGATTGTLTSTAVTGALTSTAATVTSGATTGTLTSTALTGTVTSTATSGDAISSRILGRALTAAAGAGYTFQVLLLIT